MSSWKGEVKSLGEYRKKERDKQWRIDLVSKRVDAVNIRHVQIKYLLLIYSLIFEYKYFISVYASLLYC